MTPIPLVFSHYIVSRVPPGDHPFPPRFALALTPVANGAAVKRGPVATTDSRDPSVELLLDIYMLNDVMVEEKLSFSVYIISSKSC